jgi:hypothetical protein
VKTQITVKSNAEKILVGIFDGHGKYGREIALSCKTQLENLFNCQAINNLDPEEYL